jgi:hypothetical protein
MTRREMIDRASDNASAIFMKDGELVPLWECHTRNGDIFVVATPFFGSTSKDKVSETMRKLFKDKDVVAYVYSSEAWAMQMKTTEEANAALDRYGSVGEHPDREEVLAFVCEDVTGTTTAHRKITRLPDGKPQLGKLDVAEEANRMEGRFVGLLPPQGRAQ